MEQCSDEVIMEWGNWMMMICVGWWEGAINRRNGGIDGIEERRNGVIDGGIDVMSDRLKIDWDWNWLSDWDIVWRR